MFVYRSTVELRKQRQRAAEEKQEMTRNTRSHLMAQVELTESRLGQALEKCYCVALTTVLKVFKRESGRN